jgi:hypothetical protein
MAQSDAMEIRMGRMQTRAKRRAQWHGRIEAWKASGLSQAEFCRRHGLKPADFSWRKKALARGREKCGSGAPSVQRVANAPLFVPVEVKACAPAWVEIELSNRRVIRGSLDCDPQALARLVSALEMPRPEVAPC